MPKRVSFKRGRTNHDYIVRMHNSGYQVICPICQSELIFHRLGVWCPKNANHYHVHYYPADIAKSRRESSRQRGIKKTIEALTAKGYSQMQIDTEISKYYPEIRPSSTIPSEDNPNVVVTHTYEQKSGVHTPKSGKKKHKKSEQIPNYRIVRVSKKQKRMPRTKTKDPIL